MTLNYGAQTAVSVLSLLTEGIKSVAKYSLAGSSLINPNDERNFIARAVDNQILDWLDQNSKDIKNDLPIFTSTKYREGKGSIFSSDFFYEQGSDGLAFMLSNFIPMGAIGKLGLGAKLARTAGKNMIAEAAGRGALEIGGKAAARANLIDKGIALFTASAGEAAMEAGGIQRSIIENKDLRSDYDTEQIARMAADAAEGSFQLNMALLMLTNLTEISTIFKASKLFGGVKDASRDAVVDFTKNEAGQLVRKSLP